MGLVIVFRENRICTVSLRGGIELYIYLKCYLSRVFIFIAFYIYTELQWIILQLTLIVLGIT